MARKPMKKPAKGKMPPFMGRETPAEERMEMKGRMPMMKKGGAVMKKGRGC